MTQPSPWNMTEEQLREITNQLSLTQIAAVLMLCEFHTTISDYDDHEYRGIRIAEQRSATGYIHSYTTQPA